MKSKLKQLPLFYKIYFSILIIFAIALVGFLIFLSAFIKDYNRGIPETVSQKFFNEVFESLDIETIKSLSQAEPCEFETQQDLDQYIIDKLSGDLSYTSISSSSENTKEKSYIVKSGDYKIATFILNCDEKGDYYPSDLKLHLPKVQNKTYRILDSSKLFINGIEVTDEYITDITPHKNNEFLSMPDGVSKLNWVTYEINGLTKEPKATVTDRNGNTPILTETDGIFCEEIIYDQEDEQIVSTLLTAAKQYAACMQNDVSKYSVLPYFEKGTDIYESIKTVEHTFVWDHSGYRIEDEKVSEFFKYDENTVSVRISFTHVLKKNGKADYKDITDITWFARNVDGKYLIFNRYNNI